MAARKPTAEPDTPERRSGERLEIGSSSAVTLTAGGKSYCCTIEDISLKGASLRSDSALPEDGEVVIEHPKAGCLTGYCVRRGDDMLGITFDTPTSILGRALQCVAITLCTDEALSEG